MNILLTDDELVALAVEQSKAWPTGLPTVDVEAVDALYAAALRGRRSLAVRGFFEVDVSGSELLDTIRRDAVGAEGFICLYVADGDGARASGAVNINAYRSGADWLVETVSDIGVHQFAPLNTRELTTLCHGLARAAYDRGLAGEAAEALWIAAVGPARRELMSVRKGAVDRHTILADGSLGDSRSGTTDVEGECVLLISSFPERLDASGSSSRE
jgi:hypothetical protein